MLMMCHPNNPQMRLLANRIYIYEIVQLEPPPNINVFLGFVNTYEKYLGTERLDRVSKKNLIV